MKKHNTHILDFEKPILTMEEKIEELKRLATQENIDYKKEIKILENQTKEYKKELYSKLEPFQKLQIARHAERPTFLDYVNLITTDFIELKGDRVGVDDRAIIGGIAKIDGVSEEEVLPFKYDYSFLEDVKSDLNRLQESRRYDAHRSAVTLKSVDDDRRGSEHINVYPTIYSLKMATCKMFASEIQRFAHDFGIESQMVEKFTWCYDHFDGLSTTRQPIKTDRIINMYHYYNVLTINGKPLKLDIAGVLTSQDFNKDHSSIAIDPNDFYFSEDLTKNPFEERESIYLIPYNVPRQPGM